MEVKFMDRMIKRSFEYDESFMFNIQGDVWGDLVRFIKSMAKMKRDSHCVVPVDVIEIEHDIIDFLIDEGIYTGSSGWETKTLLVVSRNPWEAFRYISAIKKDYFILILNDRPMKAEWYDAMKGFLTSEMTLHTTRIVFFSPIDDLKLRKIPFLDNKLALKTQALTSNRIGLFGNLSWIEKEGDFAMRVEPVLLGVEAMLARFKGDIEDLTDLVNDITKMKE